LEAPLILVLQLRAGSSLEAILVNKFPQLSFEEVLKMLDLKEVNLSETRFYQDVLQKGLEQGLGQGLQREAVGGAYRR
jgi:predicted transposase YdaD